MPLNCDLNSKDWPDDIPRLVRTLMDLWVYARDDEYLRETAASDFERFAKALKAEGESETKTPAQD